MKGHEAVARRLDALANFIATPVTTRRGLLARLHYLTRSDHARRAAREAGLTVTDRTLKAWLDGRRSPSRRNLERVEAAYRTVRRQNVVRYLLARLNREGRGTRVEFHPLNQSQVDRPRQRAVQYRTLNVRRWDRIVEAWANDDAEALDDAWVTDVVVDLGSEWGQYEYVTNVGFAA
ncbi:transcriptional regulator [Streptomyces sp. NBC_01373]|uniref:transcriptional regulator n=1 Tax=unclassified Streptomyces TaxID=2593676 RepID=UPI002250E680|nr:transcriptional regulator [Streptomyces sp. NBC_01373]MCX4705990.1 transcriptional regulator [Streptomyces sp. NBC_01373]